MNRLLIENVNAIIQSFDPEFPREGTDKTPVRVIAALHEMLRGYGQDPRKVLTSFSDGAPNSSDELVIVSGIRWYSNCEHHLLPFFGVAHVGYLPKQSIVGLSKLARVVDIFARRLQVQERLTNQVADLIHKELAGVPVGVVLHARHLCMEARGVCQPATVTTTSALRGQMKEDPQLRAEFFRLIPTSERVTI